MTTNTVDCVICGKPLRVEEAKTEEHGQPVHEDCYVLNLQHAATMKETTLVRRAGREGAGPR